MKNILIMRHAKSDWGDISTKDIERPLNKRGKRTAPYMGKVILERGILPELILSSSAVRATQTVKLAVSAMGFKGKVIFKDALYLCDIKEIEKTLAGIPEEINRIMIVGHNPTLEDFVSTYSQTKQSITMPTATLASLTAKIDSWGDLNPDKCSLDWIVTPKGLGIK